MAVNPRHIGAQAMNFCACKKCHAKKGKVCTTNSGAEYQTGVVHHERRDEFLAAHPEALNEEEYDQREANVERAREMAEAAAPVIQGRLGPQLHQPAIVGDARLNWMARYEMVRGVFRIMSRIDPNGAEGALDYLARLAVEMDLDLKILDEAKAQVEGQ